MKRLTYQVKKVIFSSLSDVKWHGWRHPFWITVGAPTFRLKGPHYREVEKLVRPGDPLVRRFDGFLNTLAIPGWWNHVGIYVGGGMVVHAVREGVVLIDLIDFMRTDHLIVLRFVESGDDWVRYAVKTVKALERAKIKYDFAFDFLDPARNCCTELAMRAYPNVIRPKRRWGRWMVVPDDIVALAESAQGSDKFRVVWDSRKIR